MNGVILFILNSASHIMLKQTKEGATYQICTQDTRCWFSALGRETIKGTILTLETPQADLTRGQSLHIPASYMSSILEASLEINEPKNIILYIQHNCAYTYVVLANN